MVETIRVFVRGALNIAAVVPCCLLLVPELITRQKTVPSLLTAVPLILVRMIID